MRPKSGLIVPITLSLLLTACASSEQEVVGCTDPEQVQNFIDNPSGLHPTALYAHQENMSGYENIYTRYSKVEKVYYAPSFYIVDGSLLVDIDAHQADVGRIDGFKQVSDLSQRPYDKWLYVQLGKHYTECFGTFPNCLTHDELFAYHEKNHSHIDDHNRKKFNAAKNPDTLSYPGDDQIHFGFDKSSLDVLAVTDIVRVKEYLDMYQNRVLLVRGRTDATGAETYNEPLSMRRSEAVIAELVRLGLPKNRVKASWSGEYQSGYGAEFRIAELNYERK